MHHNKRRGGLRGKRSVYAAVGAVVVVIMVLLMWQASVIAREQEGTGGGDADKDAHRRRSFLWRLGRLSLGGEKDGRVPEKAAHLEGKRGGSGVSSNSLPLPSGGQQQQPQNGVVIDKDAALVVRTDSSGTEIEREKGIGEAEGGIIRGSVESNTNAVDGDAEFNAVDDVGADDNSHPDPRKRVVYSARKVVKGFENDAVLVRGGEEGEEDAIAYVTRPHKSGRRDAEIKGEEAKKDAGSLTKEEGNEELPATKKRGTGGDGKKKAGKPKGGGKNKKKSKKSVGRGADEERDPEGGGGGQDQVSEEEKEIIVTSPANEQQITDAAHISTKQSDHQREEENRPHYHNNISLRTSGQLPPLAYVLVISNEEFLDGALVLGVSLRLRCPSLQEKRAALAIIVPKGRLSDDSLRRLREEGGFDEVVLVESLAPRAPGAYWKDTFDKLYMFSLVHYSKVVFMDADMICMKSMDKLFEFKLNDKKHVGAIGDKSGFPGTKGAAYFQTGMMVIEPSTETFREIMEEFESGVPPRGQHYNRGMNGRDGVLLRNYFQQRFHPIDNKYSRNLNPRFTIPESVISLHPRGKHKPWFDWTLPIKDPDLGKKEFGFPYIEWWDLYENHIHKQAPLYKYALRKKRATFLPSSAKLSLNEGGGGYGGDDDDTFVVDPFYEERLWRYGGGFGAAASSAVKEIKELKAGEERGLGVQPISPLSHVWVMRYSKDEYVQLLSDEDFRVRSNLTSVLTDGEQGGNMRQDWSPEGRAENERRIAVAKTADVDSFRMVVGKLGQSCDQACSAHQKNRDDGGENAEAPLACVDQGFHYYPFQNCSVLKAQLGCEICELGVYWRPHPGGDYPASGYYRKKNGEAKGPLRCFYNLMRDDRGLPKCSAFNETTTRICPCAVVGKT